MLEDRDETIAAIATSPGEGGIGIIRISGKKSLEIAKKIAKIEDKNDPIPKKVYFTNFYLQDNELIDQGLIIFFQKPNSFTGEDVVELHMHGSPLVLKLLIEEIINNRNTRLAKPGEFSYRAFMNSKIDLTQAEAIADLIAAKTTQAARACAKSLVGKFSQQINGIAKKLIKLRAHLEASLDFSEDDLDLIDNKEIITILKSLNRDLKNLLKSANQGYILKSGINIALIGRPNVGKSTLMNSLSKEQRAIVCEIPGTTRDVLRAEINIQGIRVNLSDMAGLRDAKDKIEKIGIERALAEIQKADHIFLLTDQDNYQAELDIIKENYLNSIPALPPITLIRTKIDLNFKKPIMRKIDNISLIEISAKRELGLNLIEDHILNLVGDFTNQENIFSVRDRHLEILKEVTKELKKSLKEFKTNFLQEILATNLSHIHKRLGEITGEFTHHELLNRIFSSFCIGK